jgi:hypothetical protein
LIAVERADHIGAMGAATYGVPADQHPVILAGISVSACAMSLTTPIIAALLEILYFWRCIKEEVAVTALLAPAHELAARTVVDIGYA